MKNEYTITKSLFREWAKEYHIHGTANIICFILYCLAGICGLILFILYFISDYADWSTLVFATFFIFYAVFKLFFARFIIWNRRYNICARTYGVSEWIRSHEFSEDEIILTDHTSVSKAKYENITQIKENGNAVLIFFNDNMAIRLYKDTFVTGSWDECKALISRKKQQ